VGYFSSLNFPKHLSLSNYAACALHPMDCLNASPMSNSGGITTGQADAGAKEESLELEAIGELDEIFSYINAVMATNASS
jgi:hypothetical protein